jgi:hypothetical protein
MDYAAIIWHRPNDEHKSPTTSQLKKMASVQRQVMKAITGCFRTTPTTALEQETALPSPKWRLINKIIKTIIRMKTSPNAHPIHTWINQACKSGGGLPFKSNLENLVRHFVGFLTMPLETINPYFKPPVGTTPAHPNQRRHQKRGQRTPPE